MHDKLVVEEGSYALVESPNIARVRFGCYEMDTWYGSAVYFAKDRKTLGIEYSNMVNPSRKGNSVKEDIWIEKLCVCDSCFKYTDNEDDLIIHLDKCALRNKQLGKIVYLTQEITIRKIRGSKHKLFAQNLCLFTKLYLDNKSVFFSVDQFDFYVAYDNLTQKPMGFFSKELLSMDRNNLACILVFPPYQRRHLGTLLISFSYELSKAENLISGPEKPLSPFGLVGYLRYWSTILSREFLEGSLSEVEVTTMDRVSKLTGIRHDDLLMTLKYMGVLMKNDEKVYIPKNLVKNWTITNKIDLNPLLRKECLLIQ